MRILIFGGTGMFGHKLVQELSRDFDVFSTIRGSFTSISEYEIFERTSTIENISVQDLDSVLGAIERVKPDVVINAVGIVKQLPAASDVIQTLTVNSIFPHRLGQLGREFGFRTITISTDCVFSGKKGNYKEDEPADALDLYGQSKHFGELTEGNTLTLRTSIIGRELGPSHGLVDWFLSNREKTVNGYINAIYSGFPTIIFADIIKRLISEKPDLRGLFHVSSEPINKFDLLNLINARLGLGVNVIPYEDLRIDRSLDSSLFRQKADFAAQDWPEMIDKMCADPTPYDKWKK